MILKILILNIIFVYGILFPIQSGDSSIELQDQILLHYLNRESNWFALDIASNPSITCGPKFFSDMNLLDDFLFILFWDSYGYTQYLPSRATGWDFIIEITNQGRGNSKFEGMKRNYETYLYEVVLKKILSKEQKISENEMEKLLLEAMNLYHGKFRSVWRKLVKPGSKKFDYMRPLFLNFYQTNNLGIHCSLEAVFNKINRIVKDPNVNNDLLYPYLKHFCELVKIISNDEDECFGLRWIADHKDPFFILSYFFYHRYYYDIKRPFFKDIRHNSNSRKRYFEMVFSAIRRIFNFNLLIDGNNLIFSPSFKSPFSNNVMGTEELKPIITQIVSKIIIFNSDF
jgi:hypothetical protein